MTHEDSAKDIKPKWLEFDPAVLRESLDRKEFFLRHNIAGHPLFSMDRLRRLAAHLGELPGEFYVDAGISTAGQRWEEAERPEDKLTDIFDRLPYEDKWVVLRRAELDPEYRELLVKCLTELREGLGGSWGRPIWRENSIIFITSPNRISTYHIDRECNFILQIEGEKTIYIFDRNDREVLPEEEIERFWTVDNNAARYRPEFQGRAREYVLRPGCGVHVPVNAPHWVQNHDNVSITLSINFQLTDSARANTYRTNYYLRRMGLNPTPPGISPLRDKVKAELMSSALWLWRHLKGSQPWDNERMTA
ncbi:MAG TPA: hypothetical protein VMT61_01295 [Candidatus Binataceae bacterium]|nr:hypothetical protein [Candidatus Binataceae bacterium]